MGRNRFVLPATKRYEISDGDWIEVKAELCYGDTLEFASAGATAHFAGPADVDFSEMQVHRKFIWLTDWSFCDEKGSRVPISKDAIRALDNVTATEIEAVLDKHMRAKAQAEADEKNSMSGKETPTPSTSLPAPEPEKTS